MASSSVFWFTSSNVVCVCLEQSAGGPSLVGTQESRTSVLQPEIHTI